ncbi:dipeptidase [Phytoactinopolyspora endophytica]|uniref:dipeptidase n=1 Tax=Phytoactinopolyspora endophytica TaxID=1642495 RepID=UPI00101E1D9C|nr:membrane dipeptidase [Phytoactinopolyspora endophytica]
MPDPSDLHSRAVVADAHNDLLCTVVPRAPQRWAGFFAERWLPQLRDGGVDVQVLPVFIDDVYRPEGALRQTLRMIECAHRIVAGNPDDVALCRDGAEIDSALETGRIAFVLALESAPGVADDVELLETLHRLGVRIASLAHFGRTPLGDGSAEDATGGRLTRRGVDALGLMERIGMIFDVSHLGVAGVEHVLELATRPVIATHSSARALRDHHRNLTDDQLIGIAATGGMVCVNFFAAYLHERDWSIDRLVDHLEHVASAIGVDRVGLGPDFVKEVFEETTPRCCEDPGGAAGDIGISTIGYLPGLEGPRGLPLVTEALLRRGWSEPDIRGVLGENLRALFHAELGRLAHARTTQGEKSVRSDP